MFSEVLERFIKGSPVAVMVRMLLENLLNADKMDRWFDTVRQSQYTKEILFSSIVGLMLHVVCKIRPTVHSAYPHSGIQTSVVAVYDKLKNLEPTTSQGFVRQVAAEAEAMIKNMAGVNPPLLPGYRVKFLDGNCLEASDHRLKVLRGTRAGALPGKSLVVFDPELGIALDVFPCEDGHAQERSLLSAVADTIQAQDLWIADRNFCVLELLFRIHRKSAFFVFRQHGSTPYKPLTSLKFVGKSETGDVFEQRVEITAPTGETLQVRRVVVELKKPTRNDDKHLIVLTNLPEKTVDALTVAELYRARWGIETAFQKLESHLNSEINTLGYPKAALFGFCLALVAFNLYAIVMAALRATHRDQAINETVSEYYIAQEIATTTGGMLIAIPPIEWTIFAEVSLVELGSILLNIASYVDLKKYKKNPRGPKKPRMERNQFKGHPHVSTARLLKAATVKVAAAKAA
jgi:IS4 transposase